MYCCLFSHKYDTKSKKYILNFGKCVVKALLNRISFFETVPHCIVSPIYCHSFYIHLPCSLRFNSFNYSLTPRQTTTTDKTMEHSIMNIANWQNVYISMQWISIKTIPDGPQPTESIITIHYKSRSEMAPSKLSISFCWMFDISPKKMVMKIY